MSSRDLFFQSNLKKWHQHRKQKLHWIQITLNVNGYPITGLFLTPTKMLIVGENQHLDQEFFSINSITSLELSKNKENSSANLLIIIWKQISQMGCSWHLLNSLKPRSMSWVSPLTYTAAKNWFIGWFSSSLEWLKMVTPLKFISAILKCRNLGQDPQDQISYPPNFTTFRNASNIPLFLKDSRVQTAPCNIRCSDLSSKPNRAVLANWKVWLSDLNWKEVEVFVGIHSRNLT